MNIKLLLILSGVAFLASCGESKVVEKTTQKVKCERVQSVTGGVESVTYPAKVEAAVDVNLSFRVAGVIEKINVKEGDFVRANQVVACMDNRDYKLQLDATQAEYDAIKGEVERVVALYKQQSVPENDYQKAVNGLKQITSKLAAHKNAYEDTQLKAPFSGYIQKINFNKGEAVSAGLPVMSFISSSAPELVVNLPVTEYLKRADLSSATAVLNNNVEEVFALKLVGVTHKANLNQLYEARFTVAPLNGEFPSIGMSAMVTLNYKDSEESKFTIPFSSIVEKNGENCVWVLLEGKVQQKVVEVSQVKGDGTAVITGGLTESDVVVTAGVRSLKEGQEVEPLEGFSKSNIGNIL